MNWHIPNEYLGTSFGLQLSFCTSPTADDDGNTISMFMRFEVNLPGMYWRSPASGRLICWICPYEIPDDFILLDHQLFSVPRRSLLCILCLRLLSWLRSWPWLAFKPFPCPQSLIHQIDAIICLHRHIVSLLYV